MPVKRSNILVSGYYGFANTGDEAMLTAVIAALRGMVADPVITVLSGNPRETSERYGVKVIPRFDPLAIPWAVSKADVVLSGGGSLLQDVTSRRSVFYYLSVLALAKLLGKPVMLYGQGIGPLRAPTARRLTGLVCRRADVIAVRDEKSISELVGLGVDAAKIFLTADPVMAMRPANKDGGRAILRAHGVPDGEPLLGVSVREWRDTAAFKKELAGAAGALSREYGARIVFLPLQYPHDLSVSEEIASLLENRDKVTVIRQRCGVDDCLSLIGNMDLLLGVRLHALIFGALMGTPVVGLSYDPKIDAFLESIGGAAAGTLREVTAEKIVKEARRVMTGRGHPGYRRESVDALRDGAMKNAILAVNLLNRRR
jgi:polysaccharide pyruvyl transferase CsaB